MYYVFENENNAASWIKDSRGLTQEQINEAIVLENLPQEEIIEGKVAMLKCDKSQNKVWYDYITPHPIPQDETKIKTLEEKVATMQMALDDLLLGGM